MSTPLPEPTMRRLAFIRYLYTQAVDQSRQPEPMAAASILTFHDAVELFLYLALVHLSESRKEPDFMSYWDILGPKLKPDGLAQKEPMRRLNDLRGALKHQGTIPEMLEVEDVRVSTGNFFRDNTPAVFGVDFESVSLVDLVASESARTHLADAQEHLRAGRLVESLAYSAAAFKALVNEYSLVRWRSGWRHDFMWTAGDWGLNTSAAAAAHALRPAFQELQGVIDGIEDKVASLALGLDPRGYLRFQRLVPTVWQGSGDKVQYEYLLGPPSREDARLCFDFVIDSALRLQRQ